jgi:hypothetical protein
MIVMLSDLFPGWSLDEIIRLNEYAFSFASILCAVFVMGLAEPPTAVVCPPTE